MRFVTHTALQVFCIRSPSILGLEEKPSFAQRILGHMTLEMTNRDTRSVGMEDLKEVHGGLLLLSR
jgi:hypothetical protein